MMQFTDHREIAYKLWVETGRDVKKVAELLRAGDPDEEWDPLPSAKPALIRQWALDRGWALRQFDDARQMAPDQFAATRATFHRLALAAATFLGDVMAGLLDNVDPRKVRNRIDVAKFIVSVAGHLPYNRMDSSHEAAAPKQDYTREIADLTVDELRERRRIRALAAQNDSQGVKTPRILPEMTTEPDQSIIEAQFDEDTQPPGSLAGGSKRT